MHGPWSSRGVPLLRLSDSSRSVFAALAAAAAAIVAWRLIGDAWATLGDGRYYHAMAAGAVGEVPFAFRPLVPAVVRALPGPIPGGFAAVTFASLGAATAAVGGLARRRGAAALEARLALAFWLGSFVVALSATAPVRIDAALAFALAGLFALAAKPTRPVVLGAALGASVLVHELALFALAALWIDRLTGSTWISPRPLTWRPLLGLTAFAGAVFAGVRAWVEPAAATLPATYASASMATLVAYVLDYTGGPIKHGLRVFAAFGPVLLYAAASVTRRGRRDALGAVVLVGLAAGLTLLATDTLRVMAVLTVPVVLEGARFVSRLWSSRRLLALAALAVQLAYSVTVFGHLQTFEGSLALHGIAGTLSAAGLAIAVAGARELARSPTRSGGGGGPPAPGRARPLPGSAPAPRRTRPARRTPAVPLQ